MKAHQYLYWRGISHREHEHGEPIAHCFPSNILIDLIPEVPDGASTKIPDRGFYTKNAR